MFFIQNDNINLKTFHVRDNQNCTSTLNYVFKKLQLSPNFSMLYFFHLFIKGIDRK